MSGWEGEEERCLLRVRSLCFCRWMGSAAAGRRLICLCDARHSLGTRSALARHPLRLTATNEIDIPPATRPLDCRIQSVIRPHLAHPLPSSTSTNTSNNTLHHPQHKMAIREIRFMYPSPPRIAIPLSTNNNDIVLPTPTFTPRIEIISSRLNTGKGSSSMVCAAGAHCFQPYRIVGGGGPWIVLCNIGDQFSISKLYQSIGHAYTQHPHPHIIVSLHQRAGVRVLNYHYHGRTFVFVLVEIQSWTPNKLDLRWTM